jgi:hypothetical protein
MAEVCPAHSYVLYIAAPLACACRHSVLCAHDVSSGAEQEDAEGRRSGTREEPGTLTQGAPVFPGSSRLGIEPKTPG